MSFRRRLIDLADRYLVSVWRDWWKWYSSYSKLALVVWNGVPMELQQTYFSIRTQILVSLVLVICDLVVRLLNEPWKKENHDGES